MSDLRNLDLTATDGGLKTNTLVRNNEALTGGAANTSEYFGFYVNVVGGSWSYIPIDGKAAISFTPTANTVYDYHVSSITPDAGGTGHGNLGGNVYELIDPISTWTVDADGSKVGGVLTVPFATTGSSALTSASSVLPLIGKVYTYSYTVSSYTGATKAEIKYGGQVIYTKAAVGSYTGQLTAASSVGLEVDIDVVITADFVLDSISIQRA
jgi:hypothetical protein